jgi:hypothetical protein
MVVMLGYLALEESVLDLCRKYVRLKLNSRTNSVEICPTGAFFAAMLTLLWPQVKNEFAAASLLLDRACP